MNTPQITPTPDAVKLARALATDICVGHIAEARDWEKTRDTIAALILPVLTAQQAEHAAVVARLERERDSGLEMIDTIARGFDKALCRVLAGDPRGAERELKLAITAIDQEFTGNSITQLRADLAAARAEVEKTNEYLASRKITEMFPGTFAALDDVAVRYVADLRAQLTALRKETQP